MREIKFRFWNKMSQEMVYANLLEKDVTTFWEHIKETAMQFTGLLDKNGKEIYEGDILATSNDGSDGCDVWSKTGYEYMVVKWLEGYCGFVGIPTHNEDSVFDDVYVEIIGNIYENPELLEGRN